MPIVFPRWLLLAAAVLLLLAIGWAMATGGPLLAALARVAAEPWGAILLGDLYAGFLATTALFFLLEKRATAAALFVALMVLGNVVTLLWLAFRGYRLVAPRDA